MSDKCCGSMCGWWIRCQENAMFILLWILPRRVRWLLRKVRHDFEELSWFVEGTASSPTAFNLPWTEIIMSCINYRMGGIKMLIADLQVKTLCILYTKTNFFGRPPPFFDLIWFDLFFLRIFNTCFQFSFLKIHFIILASGNVYNHRFLAHCAIHYRDN